MFTKRRVFATSKQNQHAWQHVHLIGHSAGAAFVEAAARQFRDASSGDGWILVPRSETTRCLYTRRIVRELKTTRTSVGANRKSSIVEHAQMQARHPNFSSEVPMRKEFLWQEVTALMEKASAVVAR